MELWIQYDNIKRTPLQLCELAKQTGDRAVASAEQLRKAKGTDREVTFAIGRFEYKIDVSNGSIRFLRDHKTIRGGKDAFYFWLTADTKTAASDRGLQWKDNDEPARMALKGTTDQP